MANKKTYTKESIKARMFKRIATLWEIRSVDNLDPVVKLLVESLASEVFKLAGEMEDIEDRIVDKLARAFTPSFMVSASPAHAILHARSSSGSTQIDNSTEFIYKDPHFIQRHNLRKLAMSVVCGMTIFDADITHLISNGRLHNVTPGGGKDHVANAMHQDPIFNNTIWLGVDTGRYLRTIEKLSFYFEFPLMESCEEYFRILGHSKWSHDGQRLGTVAGLGDRSFGADGVEYGIYDQRSQINRDVAGKYDLQFVTIQEKLSIKELKKERLPAELSGAFSDSIAEELKSEVVWFKVEFPPAFDSNILSHLSVHINCFPVANVLTKQSLTTVTPLSSIVPLEKEQNEYFIYMDSVTDSRNLEYKQVRSHQESEIAGTYMIRRGGSERFNSINARDYLVKLLDLFRDEAIAFSSIDKDISGTAENLMGYLSQFDKKLQSYDNDNEHTSYLILGSDIKKRTNLTVRYCMTNGAIANGIRTSERLTPPELSDIDLGSAVLMTNTRGGRKSPDQANQKDTYQYLLTSRDRIYTKEDVRLFCKCNYGDYFSDVRVDSGYEVSNRPKEGIIKTTEVVLIGAGGRIEPEILVRDVLSGLNQRSPDGMNYRIKLM